MATTLLALTDRENPQTKQYPVTSFACASQTGTLTFGAAHGFAVGNHIAVSGSATDGFNGVFEVTKVVSTTEIEVIMPGVSDGGSAGTPFCSRVIEAAHTGFPLLLDPKSGRLLVEGIGGGGGQGVPAPTRLDIFQHYTYDPNSGGAAWRDDRTMFKVVADHAALLALKYPSQLVDGAVAMRTDNDLIYRFIAPAVPTDSITDANWRLVGGAIPVPSRTQMMAFNPQSLTRGQIALVADDNTIWEWTGDPTKYNNGWREILAMPTREDILQRLDFDPERASGARLEWVDDRASLLVVADQAELFAIPVSHLKTGKLVYVLSEKTIFELVADPTAMAGDTSDWDALGLGLPEYNRYSDLPQPSATVPVEEGELALVRFHQDAVTPLNQLFVARANPPGSASPFSWVPVSRNIHYKALLADPDVPDPRDKDIQICTQTGHAEIKTWDAASNAWIVAYNEDELKGWIAAGNLFTGTIQDPGHGTAGAIEIGNMPAQTALGATDKGHYYTWAGQDGFVLPANGIGGAASAIDGAVMNPGDWVQIAEQTPGNFIYTHIPGDLLAKGRGDALYGLNAWSQGAYELGSLTVYGGKIYKAARPILATDTAPNTTGSGWNVVALASGLRFVNTDGDLPANAPLGEVYLVINSAKASNHPSLYIWDQPSAQWRAIGGGTSGSSMILSGGKALYNVGVPIGSIQAYAGSDVPAGWLFCDGSAYDPNLFPKLNAVLNRATVPDLRLQFIRGATAGLDAFAKHRWTTGMPRSRFGTNSAGGHTHSYQSGHGSTSGIRAGDWHPGEIGWGDVRNTTDTQGAHSHSITGGDSETAPVHVYVRYIIKALETTILMEP